MAKDHVQNPPDPQKGYKNKKNISKTGWGRAWPTQGAHPRAPPAQPPGGVHGRRHTHAAAASTRIINPFPPPGISPPHALLARDRPAAP